ncbi:hypothetical protein N0V93_000709 [Gnomoniopsis smithogilvyi]|uniref:PLC-like phosphodiesterase n=1 Tax=Gnomoniopsis smithogilvyi TaxID=1191159 RepID=A0A9W8Z2Q6_9PEZI|nr:hypothetical protein N0V93_000709 [Gnomoniopsis smithogilvyi]
MRSSGTRSFAVIASLATLAHAACNGQDALCSRPYSNVTFVGAHDSAFFGPFITQNQNINVSAQLALGVRFLQAQTHDFIGNIQMCHTSCLELNAGPLSAFLAPVKAFLDGNPNEVVTLLLTNGDAIPVTEFASVFEAAGLTDYVFAPSGTLALDQWPTLQTMIDDGTRLVVWMDYHANTAQVPYILDEFAYYFETPYNETVASHNFADCTIDRPAGASADGRMGLVNHMLHIEFLGIQIPDEGSADITNSPASIGAQSSVCKDLYGRAPNVVLLDYIDKGDAMAAQLALNGVQ